eukprot:superscaffoldBa00003444_g16956
MSEWTFARLKHFLSQNNIPFHRTDKARLFKLYTNSLQDSTLSRLSSHDLPAISSSYFLFSHTYIPRIYIPSPQHPFLLSGSYLCCPFPPGHLSFSSTRTNHGSRSDGTNNSRPQQLHELHPTCSSSFFF